MISINDVGGILASKTPVHGTDGKIGNVGQVFLDDTSGDPTWITVHTGLFGGKESFVPLEGATYEGDQVDVPFSKEQVKDAPRLDTGASLSPEQENELFAYYGIDDPYEDGWDRRPEAQGGDSIMQREASPAEYADATAEPVAATPAAGVASPEQLITGTEEPIAGTDPSVEPAPAGPGAGVLMDEGSGAGSSVGGWSRSGSTVDGVSGSGTSPGDGPAGGSSDDRSGTAPSPSDGSVAAEPAEPAAPTGRVRLRRYVVTETYADDGTAVTTEDIHIERDAVDSEDAQTDGGSDDPDGGPGRHARS